jgi:VWFA-related protein
MALLSHRQGWSLAVLLAFFPCLFYASSTSDGPLTTYHTGTSEVRISFFATDEHNHPVEDLGKDDFAIVDDGVVIRDFRSLARTSDAALDLVLLVDDSESIAPRFQEVQQDILKLISSDSLSPDDRISVVTFAGMRLAIFCLQDCGAPATRQKLLAAKAEGATPLFDAVNYTAHLVTSQRKPSAREVVILFSDGHDTISRASYRDALQAMTASGALLYTVNIDRSEDSSSQGSRTLQQMAESTGGRAFQLPDHAIDLLQAVLADLHASYIVTYQLPNRTAGFHSLRILPKHNLNLQFHCRKGYNYDDEDR